MGPAEEPEAEEPVDPQGPHSTEGSLGFPRSSRSVAGNPSHQSDTTTSGARTSKVQIPSRHSLARAGGGVTPDSQHIETAFMLSGSQTRPRPWDDGRSTNRIYFQKW